MKSTHVPLFIVALLANGATVVAYLYAERQPGGTGAAMAFAILWFPAIWLIALAAMITVMVIKRKVLFKRWTLLSTILLSLFCTPIPIIAFFRMIHPTPAVYRVEMGTNTIQGRVYITEEWNWSATHKRYVDKRFVADSGDEAKRRERSYKKDSLWVYFNEKGDTVKLEFYRADSLVWEKGE
jgi:hypothetical protein